MRDVRLRPVEQADLDVFFDHQQDKTARHQAAFVSQDPTDRAAFDAHWERVLSNPNWVARTIEAEAQPVGNIVQFDIEGDPEITYWIGRDWWGMGFATRAVALLLSEFPDRPMYARVAADNVGSRRVLEKNGFKVIAEELGYATGRGVEIDEFVMRLG